MSASASAIATGAPRVGAARAVALAIPVAALLVAVYAGMARTLWATWTTNDNYSHGPLVPLVSALLIWGRRRRLAGLPLEGHGAGIALVALACALEIAGLRADVFALQGWSLILMLFGVSLGLLGRAWTRALAFPLLFLAFMLTFPPVIVNQLSFALKELTVRFATRAAELLGATLLRDGMTLHLRGGELRVENPCSGLRSLLALLATGALFAGLQPGAWWRRAILFLAAIPMALAANALRITTLILVGHYAGVERAGGLLHDASGYALYLVALLGLLGVRRALAPRARGPATPRPTAIEAMAR